MNFVMLYLIGRYLKLHYTRQYTQKVDMVIYLSSGTLTAILAVVLHKFGCDTYRAFCYNSPFVLINAVAIFLFFTKLHFTSRIINYLASSCLAIYLMQEGGIHVYAQIKSIYMNSGVDSHFFSMILIFFVASMFIPLVVDKIRIYIFGKFEAKVANMLDVYVFKRWIE